MSTWFPVFQCSKYDNGSVQATRLRGGLRPQLRSELRVRNGLAMAIGHISHRVSAAARDKAVYKSPHLVTVLDVLSKHADTTLTCARLVSTVVSTVVSTAFSRASRQNPTRNAGQATVLNRIFRQRIHAPQIVVAAQLRFLQLCPAGKNCGAWRGLQGGYVALPV
jgi:hypothetical protein